MAEVTCKRCGSSDIVFNREETVSVGGSTHSFGGRSGHGILYWCTIGWFLWIMKWMLALCTLGFSLLFTRKRKDKLKGKTLSASKTFNRTMAVCQGCGNTWKA